MNAVLGGRELGAVLGLSTLSSLHRGIPGAGAVGSSSEAVSRDDRDSLKAERPLGRRPAVFGVRPCSTVRCKSTGPWSLADGLLTFGGKRSRGDRIVGLGLQGASPAPGPGFPREEAEEAHCGAPAIKGAD